MQKCPAQLEPEPKPIVEEKSSKYYREIGAEMIGNHLVIRMEKDKNKKKKKTRSNWVPPCDCDVVEIRRPSGDKGPRIINPGGSNQILFRINSKNHLNRKFDPTYKPQTLAYKINKESIEHNGQCRKISIHPQFGGPVSQEVTQERFSDCDQEIYLLKVAKKTEATDRTRRKVEVEFRGPKPFVPKPKMKNDPSPRKPSPLTQEAPMQGSSSQGQSARSRSGTKPNKADKGSSNKNGGDCGGAQKGSCPHSKGNGKGNGRKSSKK